MFAKEDLELIRYLVENGADLNIMNRKGRTPLMKFGGNLPILKYLVSIGLDINIKDEFGDTLLIKSAKDYESSKFLVEAGADINAVSSRNVTALMMAMNDYRTLKMLLEAGADPNIRDIKEGYTAMQIAVDKGDVRIVKALLEHGADINAKGSNGLTPLQVALHDTYAVLDVPFVNLLIRSGANRNVKYPDDYGRTPLMQVLSKWYRFPSACRDIEATIALMLKSDTLDLTVPDDDGNRVIQYLTGMDNNPTYRAIKAAGGSEDVPQWKVEFWDLGLEPNTGQLYSELQNYWSNHRNKNKRNIIMLLNEGGVDPNEEIENKYGYTLLYLAIRTRDAEIVRLMQDKGADPNGKAARMPLMVAATNGNVEIVKMLIDAGADIHYRDKKDLSALDMARKNKNDDVVRLLEKLGGT